MQQQGRNSPELPVLILAPSGNDAANAATVLANAGHVALVCRDMQEVCALRVTEVGTLLATEEALDLDSLDRLLKWLAQQPPWSDVPVVVISSARETTQKAGKIVAAFGGGGNVSLLERPLATVTLRRAVQVALSARQRQLQIRELLAEREAVLTSISDAFIAVDEECRYIYLNEKAAMLAGKPRQELLGKTVEDLFAAPGPSRVFWALQQAIRAKMSAHLEQFHVPLQRWFEIRIYPSEQGASVFTTDITERRRAEEALRESEERARLALAVGRLGTWSWNVPLDIVTADERCREICGLASEGGLTLQLIGERIHPEDWPRIEQALSEAAEPSGDGAYAENFRFVHRDGTVRWVTSRGRMLFDEGNNSGGRQPIVMLGTIQDVTEQKQVEEALLRSGAKLQLLDDLGEKARGLSDPRQVMAVVAQGLGKYLKVARCAYADVESESDDFLIQHDYTNGCVSSVGRYNLAAFGPRALDDMHAGRTLVIRNVDQELSPEGGGNTFSSIGIQALICCPLLKEGSLRAMMAVHETAPRDWTREEVELVEAVVERSWAYIERARAEAALREAKEALARANGDLETAVAERTIRLRETVQELEAFSYSIAHDMRAPLRSMQGFAKILQQDYSEKLDTDGSDYLRRIGLSASRLDQLITDILNYSKVVRDQLELEPVSFETLLKDIIESYPNLQPPHLQARIMEPLPLVLGNRAALTQVVSNLLGNAVKFARPDVQPEVVVRAEETENYVRIWIEDNGVGIPEDCHERIFQIFQRLHRPGLYEGTGIGLAIVRKAVERMGGEVGVTSTPGEGSKFWLQLQRPEAK